MKAAKRMNLFGLGLVLPLGAQRFDQFSFFYEFIWLFFAAINLLNLVYLRLKIASIVRDNPELEQESKELMRWLFIFAVLPFLLLYLFQWLGGFRHAFYVFSNNYHSPYVVLGWLVFTLIDLAFLYSMLLGGGATTVVKFHKAFPRMPENEQWIKVITVLCVLGGSLSLFMSIATNTFSKIHG
jgi:hypothetical protein